MDKTLAMILLLALLHVENLFGAECGPVFYFHVMLDAFFFILSDAACVNQLLLLSYCFGCLMNFFTTIFVKLKVVNFCDIHTQ